MPNIKDLKLEKLCQCKGWDKLQKIQYGKAKVFLKNRQNLNEVNNLMKYLAIVKAQEKGLENLEKKMKMMRVQITYVEAAKMVAQGHLKVEWLGLKMILHYHKRVKNKWKSRNHHTTLKN